MQYRFPVLSLLVRAVVPVVVFAWKVDRAEELTEQALLVEVLELRES